MRIPLHNRARIRAALDRLDDFSPELRAAIVDAARKAGLLPPPELGEFCCQLCNGSQVITCLLCDADACARCYTCTRPACPNAAVLPRPPLSPAQEWERSLGLPQEGGGGGNAAEMPWSAGSGWREVAYTSMTVTFGGRELRLGPGTLQMREPHDNSEHRT